MASPAIRQHPRVAIVGGGISGLAAAFHLRELSVVREFPVEVVLFEREQSFARPLGTVCEGGLVMETGADSFLSSKPWALDLTKRLGLESELIGTRERSPRTYVVRAGRLVEIPEGFTLLAPTRFLPVFKSPLFTLGGKLRMALEPLIPPRPSEGDESLASFVTRRLGREVLDRVAQPLAGGIYTTDPSSLSLQATMPRFLEIERRFGSLFRGLRAPSESPPGQSMATNDTSLSQLVSFRRGMRMLVDALEAKLAGCLRRGTDVIRLTRTDDGIRWRLRLSTGSEFEADALVLATPAFVTARLLEPHAGEVARLLAGISYSSAATVNLAYRIRDCPALPECSGFVVPITERRKIIAATFSSLKFPGRSPEGMVVIRAFLGGSLQNKMMELDDRAMIDAALDEFHSLLGIGAEPVVARVHRWENSMPQYTVGHLDRIAGVESAVRKIPGLALAGAAYRGVGIPDCIRSGEQAAEDVFNALTRTSLRSGI